ncbi:uncharacterized protein LOC117122571 [Anneissia japonica]|uniref:uncharacterized protein LOC117122571 n=1 Tax=Anneissia japonica TaxID=1529436 RepID=UPI0014257F12|nr:uncharacterized protein LOC117122571 [Anneissia japonica]XP_033124077.1 uncharacterized protein LOC117122571 [Anneissia japonica]
MDTPDAWEKRLVQICQGSTKEDEKQETFDDVADTLDQAAKESGYTAPQYCSTLLSRYIPDRKANILDFGCGTGLAGEQLHQLGYQHIDGLDCAPKCLQVAENKQIYRRLFCDFFSGQTLNLETDFYDGLICIGGFYPLGLKANCFSEWIRTVQPGGYILNVFRNSYLDTCADYNDGKLEGEMKALESDGKWKLISTEKFEAGRKEWNMILFIHQIL